MGEMRIAKVLTIGSMACAAIASCVTLVWEGAFPDSVPPASFNGVLAEARGWSAVTLVLALPIGIAAMLHAERSARAKLGWLGVLAYLVYTYLEMAVSPPFTALYLVYIVAFATAIPAGIAVARTLDPRELSEELAHAPRRGVAIWSLVFAGLLALAWLKDILARTWNGQFGWPQGEPAIGHVVHALDLGLLVPLGLSAGVLLLRKHPIAWIVAGVNLVVAVCMGAALVAMVGVSGVISGASILGTAPFFIAWLGWLAFAALSFFRHTGDLHPLQDGP
jgi:hypothetical protein